MKEKEIIEGVANATAKHLPATTKSLDNALSSIVNIVDLLLTPFQAAKIYKDAKIQEFKENVIQKASKIPESDLKKADLNIVGPTLDALKYNLLDEDLSEMFENLLVSSLDKKQNVFPSFVDIVRQFNSDEAKLLKRMANIQHKFPAIDLIYRCNDGGFYEVLVNFSDLGFGVCQKPELTSAYLDEFEKFGLISIESGKLLADDKLYDSLKKHSFILQVQSEYKNQENGQFEFVKKIISFTSFGKSFISSCVLPK